MGQRILIFGNGGSGKTSLARALGQKLGLPIIHLDDLRWEPGQYGVARDNQVVANEVREASLRDENWIMEGVYGWLAGVAMPRATQLIWLDLPEEECLANVRERGVQGGGSDEGFAELLVWISEYRLRRNSSCHAAHLQLFEDFPGSKAMLGSRGEMAAFVADFS
ncbi:ATPase AAA [Youhaiella tibetensis]|uniref:AAA family ATPase n=1 Tax=Paradevosia tibetensis TaxID=1447062 RepID=UPI000672607D|nr:AAA family ATPase [Youhaiella tibetensis]AKR55583.1 ATPase AAA [Devosia sp. H5989]GGF21688.1 ATPase AAA [Youhaiella tibetensis]